MATATERQMSANAQPQWKVERLALMRERHLARRLDAEDARDEGDRPGMERHHIYEVKLNGTYVEEVISD